MGRILQLVPSEMSEMDVEEFLESGVGRGESAMLSLSRSSCSFSVGFPVGICGEMRFGALDWEDGGGFTREMRVWWWSGGAWTPCVGEPRAGWVGQLGFLYTLPPLTSSRC
jgi:hypothetical protein